MTDSPNKARLRAVVDRIRHSEKPTYNTMTDDELQNLLAVAQGYLVAHPNNQEAFKRYDLLVQEIERRRVQNFN